MSDYGKSCGNCGAWVCPFEPEDPCDCWEPIHCPYCSGSLSEIREHKEKQYRHCFACHMEFEEK